MKLSLEKLAVECADYRTVVSMNLDCKRLSRISEIGKCRYLEYVSLRFNELSCVKELAACPKLWVIDLLQNHISNLSGLKDFQVLGSLNLSCNDLTIKALDPLQNTFIINLELTSHKITRAQIISLLPYVWILNDVYITEQERISLNCQNVPSKKINFTLGPAAEFLKRFQNSMTEIEKFEYLIYDLEKVCELEWQVKNNSGKKLKTLKFPKFQICRWKDIKSASRLVISCVMFLFLEGFYPCSLVKEIVAIIVTESYPDNTPLVEALELCELPPHYILSFIMLMKKISDGNPLWKRIVPEYLIKNFSEVQRRWSEQNSLWILDLSDESHENRSEVLENRQHLSIFVLTVLVKFDLMNQIVQSGKKIQTKLIGSILDGLLKYSHIDEVSLMSDTDKKDQNSSILTYSHSLQNLQIAESNSSRYGSFLVKTKGSGKGVQEDSFVINKFEELSQIQKDVMSRQDTADKDLRAKRNKPALPPVQSMNLPIRMGSDGDLHKKDWTGFKPTEVFSADNSEKPEFMLGSSNQFKRQKNWKSLAEPPTLYSLTQSQSNFRYASQKTLPLVTYRNSIGIQSYYDDLVKVSITPSEDLNFPINFKIEFPIETTFLTRYDQEPDRLKPRSKIDDTSSIQSEIKFKSIGSEQNTKKWYPVAQRTRFVIDENFVQNLKPCNFYEQHKELLPPIPEKVYKKSAFLLQGKQPEVCNLTKEIVKDTDHLMRVITRENTPWVQYKLKPTNKVRQDVFCANYGELLVFYM